MTMSSTLPKCKNEKTAPPYSPANQGKMGFTIDKGTRNALIVAGVTLCVFFASVAVYNPTASDGKQVQTNPVDISTPFILHP